MEKRPKKLLDQACTEASAFRVRHAIQRNHNYISAAETYVRLISRCILFHNEHRPDKAKARRENAPGFAVRCTQTSEVLETSEVCSLTV